MSGKVVMITGCSDGGIGCGLAKVFAEKGCTVFATARKVTSMSTLKGERFVLIALDVTSTESCQAAIQQVLTHPASEGRIDILINNAGAGGAGPLLETKTEDVIKTYDVNVFGVMRMNNIVIPHMIKQGKGGHIVVVGSIAGIIPTPWSGIYSSSKAAVNTYTNVLREEVRGLGIKVTLMAPGGVKSNFGNRQEGTVNLPPDSVYQPLKSFIMKRANAGQAAAWDTEVFCRNQVEALLKPHPREFLSVGTNTTVFWILSWFPTSLVMALGARMFGADRLGKIKSA